MSVYMSIRLLPVGIVLVGAVTLASCKKSAPPAAQPGTSLTPSSSGQKGSPGIPGSKQLPAGHPPVGDHPPTGGPMANHPPMKGGAAQGRAAVEIPETVKSRWRAVRVVVEEKASKKGQTVEINVGGQASVPGTGLTIKVGAFLPAFTMRPGRITSSSAEPTNPAAQVEITEAGKPLFKGWLFARFPTMHAVEHPRYQFLLKEGVSK